MSLFLHLQNISLISQLLASDKKWGLLQLLLLLLASHRNGDYYPWAANYLHAKLTTQHEIEITLLYLKFTGLLIISNIYHHMSTYKLNHKYLIIKKYLNIFLTI